MSGACATKEGQKEMVLDRFIPLSEAAHRLRVSVKETRAMINSGKIKGGILAGGEMVVSEDTLPKKKEKRKEDLPEYKKYAHLRDVGIGIGEAAKRYAIPKTTLYQWFLKGYINSVGRNGQKVLLNEQAVAYCAGVYHRFGTKGRRLFNSDGTPFRQLNSSSLK
jgi:hypothetical protein